MIDLNELSQDEDFVTRLNNRQFNNLSIPDTRYVLSHMGKVMSLRNVHRKVALTAAILKEMKIGESIPAEELTYRANKFLITAYALNVRVTGNLCILLKKWGLIERHKPRLGANYLYRRIK